MNFYINLANRHFSEEKNIASFIICKLSCISKTSCNTNAIFGQKQELKPSRAKIYVIMDICNLICKEVKKITENSLFREKSIITCACKPRSGRARSVRATQKTVATHPLT